MQHLFLLFALLTPAIVSSQIFVNTTATGNNNGSSWADAYTDLQTALTISNDGDEIWIAAGTYQPNGPSPESSHFVINKELKLYGGFAGVETLLEERDWEANPTILSGDLNDDDIPGNFNQYRTDNAHHLIQIKSNTGTPTIDGLIVQGGNTLLDEIGDDNSRWRGGAIQIQSNCRIVNCIIQDNVGYQGAAIGTAINDTLISVAILNCSVLSNLSFTGNVYLVNVREISIDGCHFEDNIASDHGGALTLGNSGLSIDASTFKSNSATWGGAVAVFQNLNSYFNEHRISLTRTVFDSNRANNFGGGLAIQNFLRGTAIIIDSCQFIGNEVTTNHGGGFRLYYVHEPPGDGGANAHSSLQLSNSLFSNNRARVGGGSMITADSDTLSVNITECQFILNEASVCGGGAYLWSRYSNRMELAMDQCRFVDNYAGDGAGLIMQNSYTFEEDSLRFTIDECFFAGNHTPGAAGATWLKQDYSNSLLGPVGSINGSHFENNSAEQTGGAIYAEGGRMDVSQCEFLRNYTAGNSLIPGGGAVSMYYTEGKFERTRFTENMSDQEGAVMMIDEGSHAHFESSLMFGNSGISTIYNLDSLSLINTTLIDTAVGIGIYQPDSGALFLQNSIISAGGYSYLGSDRATVKSQGGNICTDASFGDKLPGYMSYSDMNETAPELDGEWIPIPGGNAYNTGNPDGVHLEFDLAGAPRISHQRIDIGAYEQLISRSSDILWGSDEVSVYPNPVSDFLTVKFLENKSGKVDIMLFDHTGRLQHTSLFRDLAAGRTITIDVQRFASGMYYLLLSAEEAIPIGSEISVIR